MLISTINYAFRRLGNSLPLKGIKASRGSNLRSRIKIKTPLAFVIVQVGGLLWFSAGAFAQSFGDTGGLISDMQNYVPQGRGDDGSQDGGNSNSGGGESGDTDARSSNAGPSESEIRRADYVASLGKGDRYFSESDFDAALLCYQQALAYEPHWWNSNKSAHIGIALCQAYKALATGKGYAQIEDWENALVYLNRALKYLPAGDSYTYNKSLIQSEINNVMHRWLNARAAAMQRITSAYNLNNQGNNYFQSGDYANAQTEYQIAAQTNPNDSQIQKNLDTVNNIISSANTQNLQGVECFQNKDYANAKAFFEAAAKIYPLNSVISQNLINAEVQLAIEKNDEGNKLAQIGDYAAAVTIYQIAAQNSPEDSVIRQNLLGAQKHLDDAYAQNELGRKCFQNGNYANAKLFFEMASKNSPKNTTISQNLINAETKLAILENNAGNKHFQEGNCISAISDYQAALNNNPDNSEIHHNLDAAEKQFGTKLFDNNIGQFTQGFGNIQTHLKPADFQINKNLPVAESQLAATIADDNYNQFVQGIVEKLGNSRAQAVLRIAGHMGEDVFTKKLHEYELIIHSGEGENELSDAIFKDLEKVDLLNPSPEDMQKVDAMPKELVVNMFRTICDDQTKKYGDDFRVLIDGE